MYNDIFKAAYDTYENRYTLCFKEYMKGVKYNRSKRKYVNTSNKIVLWTAVNDKLKFEEEECLLEKTIEIL